MQKPMYFDYAATTPVDERVAEAMIGCLTRDGNFGNPASRSHLIGWQAEEAVEIARGDVAKLIGCDTREIVWTSGATESNNLAIKGALEALLQNEEQASSTVTHHVVPHHTVPHIVTSAIEHKAVLDTCAELQRRGCEVTYLTPPADGVIRAAQVAEAMRPQTRLVSIMHVNNEIGVINEIAGIGKICRDSGVLFHVDAAQSAGKVEIDVASMCIDLLSISAHKMYGPKGIGALYVRRSPDVNIAAQIHGGGHERGMRSGTLPTHQIVGLGKAAAIAKQEMVAESKQLLVLRDLFLSQLQQLTGWQLNGSKEQRVPGNLNISFADVEGETLLMSLRDIALSTGSACTSASLEPSYVLSAIGVPSELAHSSLRISLGRYTTETEVKMAADKITAAVTSLRKSPPVRYA
ncbi:IscS subfamily cysteine desulfurase [Saccharophagus degradans]|uniref:IscS subfamily cysteine desulfurase n=1 Tax=Saccharophagus degradans TaxID=86304 RepID=UPI0024781774|nr:IscS subfamily cysteine desulfurase [Saccharophagus degradans]WGP00498.1 IscS subfamily cysteine desulfurase [Saccharophagus degradans]